MLLLDNKHVCVCTHKYMYVYKCVCAHVCTMYIYYKEIKHGVPI